MELRKIRSSKLNEHRIINRVLFIYIRENTVETIPYIYIPYVLINTLYTSKYITIPQYWGKDGA